MKNLLLLLAFLPFNLLAQQDLQATGPESSSLIYLGKTDAIGNATDIAVKAYAEAQAKNSTWKAVNQKAPPPIPGVKSLIALPNGPDPIRQDPTRMNNDIEPLMVADGLSFLGFFPPDPVGDIGKEYYIQMCNGSADGAQILIMDKQGEVIFGPVPTEPLFWEPFGQEGQGDPIVIYDEHAERWLLTEFAPQGSNRLLIAVSETSNPLGAYHIYIFQTPNFPDYPKYAVWNDAYVVTTNEFAGDVAFYALERDSMLVGGDAAIQRFALPRYAVTSGGQFVWQVCTPSDWDGKLAPSDDDGTFVMRIHDDSWNGGTDELDIYELHVNWDDPSNGRVDGPLKIPLAPFESDVCEDGLFNCLVNPNGQEMGALQQTIMHRLQYRNFGTHETLVGNFVVDADGNNQAGIRWFELRKSGEEEWSLYQEGTFSPDSLDRFMGSIAMDEEGNLAMGYAFVGPETNPGMAMTGRRAEDPLGMMTVNEHVVIESSSPNTNNRWGDYSSMNVDPVDGKSFWYTGEFRERFLWETKIFNVVIDPDSIDLRPLALRSPQSSVEFSDDEIVSVTLQNAGTDTIERYRVQVIFDGLASYDTSIVGVIPPGRNRVVTFDESIDLSGITTVPVTVISTSAADMRVVNDTLSTTVSLQLPDQLDLVSLEINEDQNCTSEGFARIGIRNRSFQDLGSIDLIYSVNGGPQQVDTWNGLIPALTLGEFDLELSGLVDGKNKVDLTIARPNGNAAVELDQRLVDSVELNFEAVKLTLTIQLDSFPAEVRWFVRDTNFTPFVFDGPYEEAGGLVTEVICVPSDCYILTMFDGGRNGLCCSGGEGFYELVDESGQVYAKGSTYGSVEDTEFCVPYSCRLDLEILEVTDASTTESEDGSILVSSANSVGNVRYTIDGNDLATTMFSDLQGNQVYEIVASDENGCRDSALVEVGQPVSSRTLQASGRVELRPNPTTGVFTIELYDAVAGFEVPYTIYNISGQKVSTGFMTKYAERWVTMISLRDRADGQYFIVMETEEGNVVKEVQVVKN